MLNAQGLGAVPAGERCRMPKSAQSPRQPRTTGVIAMIGPMLLGLSMAVCSQPAAWPATSPPPRWEGSIAWRESDFAVLQSELSPAVLVWSRHASLRLFAVLPQWGLEGPREAAVHTAGGGRLLQRTDAPAGLNLREMDQPWIAVHLDSAPGRPGWSTCWLVALQHRPREAQLSSDGLDLTFDGPAGFVALMPVHGSRKLTPPAEAGQAPHSVGMDGPACERWARVLRHWPLNCREEFQVLPGRDRLRLRGTCSYVDIQDDWGTSGLRMAPLPPTLALALRTGFPGDLSETPDPAAKLPTAYGPYLLVPGDRYTVELPLRRLNETEVQQPPNLDDPVVGFAAQQIAQRMQDKFADGALDRIWDHGGGGNYCWQAMGDRWYAKALAYTPEPARTNAAACLGAYVREWILNEARYKPFQGKLILEGPGIGNWGGYDDSGKFSSNLLETLWCFAHYTGDWDALRERWGTVQKLFVTPRECRWRGSGRDAIAEMGDEAAPPMCLARMAYHLGDLDTYGYAAYIHARELVHLWVKTQPDCAEWFRGLQPWHDDEPMSGPLYLTNLWGDLAGWQIDGPDYPRQTGERQYRNRWVRFGNEDVGAFMRESLGEATLRRELDWWLTREDNPYKPGESTAHITPSMEQLRSLLLNEPPAQLAKLAPMQEARIGRAADAISYYLSFVRTGRPVQYTRLVPTNLPDSPWMLGLEREADGSDGALVTTVLTKEGQWPVLADWGWPPPRTAGDLPGADRFSYGQLIAGPTPPTLKWERLSWVTNVRYGE
jgi:hypothetical protein